MIIIGCVKLLHPIFRHCIFKSSGKDFTLEREDEAGFSLQDLDIDDGKEDSNLERDCPSPAVEMCADDYEEGRKCSIIILGSLTTTLPSPT